MKIVDFDGTVLDATFSVQPAESSGVSVKGTTSRGDTIILTRNEVLHAIGGQLTEP